ncbi:MAG TPA: alpha-L-rhamnosidase C-terminal domain-containing protein, partial [Bacteroidales bacterium]|nr:alpha-L-rhamnosidase C-terminal domain-containing protein [Bacteroidales bacterium]
REWDAKWISVPGESPNEYGVYLFRKTIDLKKIPLSFVIHVSADNRYKLYVNEKLVSLGPARGDLYFWNFETVDIAPFLTEGNNIIAAKVWNEGNIRPEAQISWRTGFILQGSTNSENILNTDNTWKCIRDTSYQPLTTNEVIGYFVTGPGEFVDMRKNMKGWKRLAFNDSTWKNAASAFWRGGSPKGLQDAFGWMLVPSSIPQMELSMQRLNSTRESEGVSVPFSFPAQETIVTIPANTKASILLDQGHLTNAYPTMNFSNGRDASISLKYAEALFIPAKSELYGTTSGGYMGSDKIAGKGNRDEVKGKIFLGRKDSLISDGTLHQEYTTLYWRTYRYILLDIETKDDPLLIDDIYGTFTGYPFQMNATFATDRTDLQKILDIGWRTARLCAIETYMDCPYYEQLQYIGDTRIQALVSIYNSGDDRLVRNAINLMDHSRIPEGPTLSRHPSFSPQLIPTFSLWYIGVLHDFWMYRPDSLFIKDKIGGTRQVLDFFHRHQQPDGSLINVPYWNFTDWVPDWPGGVGPKGNTGNCAIYDLQLLWAYQLAAELESSLGMKAFAEMYTERANLLMETIRKKYWNESKGLFADTPEKDFYSQHANSLAILSGMIQGKEAEAVAGKMLSDKTLTQASIYFRYYLHMALVKAGLGNEYLKWLDKWHENIAMGLTTWAEDSEINTARSDCHAWGASPNIEFYRTILGIDTDAPGFTRVKIEPHLGELRRASGEIPHPYGKISVKYIMDKGKWNVEINLPEGLNGSFVWKDEIFDIREGINKFII